ncbi:Protein MODIFYING WALL LIGNIN-2 [Linum perenne]
MEMERKAILLSSLVSLLGLLSATSGFAAEATRIKASQVQFTTTTQCAYPRSPALPLGLTSAVSLMLAQLIINVATGCICCRRTPNPSNSNWTIASICFVVSWFTFVVAFLLLLTGAALNDQHGEESMYFGNYYCYVVKPGVFAGGAVLALVSVTLGIIYYLTLNSAKTSAQWWGNRGTPTTTATTTGAAMNQSGIAMGHPQFPVQGGGSTQDPVFVHEDTYMRRQFT